MKKTPLCGITILILIISVFLISCSTEPTYEDGYNLGYESGYAQGYSDGKSDADWNQEDEYYEGYEDGYRSGKEDSYEHHAQSAGENANWYARNNSNWSAYEARWIIDIYQSGIPDDGYMPAYEEYLDAIDTLIAFYEYFELKEYEG